MKVTNGVEMLEIHADVMGHRMAIHPTVLYDGQEAVLVDTGMPGHWPLIRAEMEAAGISPDQLRAILLTHQDIDHIGGLPEILATLGRDVEVVAHVDDKPYIEGERSLIKMNSSRMAERLAGLPAEVREKLEAVFRNPPHAKVTRPVRDGEELAYCGGIRIIHTPGHTPGHISLYHIPSRTVVAGDATAADHGKPVGPNPGATPDLAQAKASLKKLAALDIQYLICYHGGLCTGDVAAQLAALA